MNLQPEGVVALREDRTLEVPHGLDECFDHFTDRHLALLAEQRAGVAVYHVLVADDDSVVGRFNLILGDDASADLGYRVAREVAGRGVATAMVRELCQLASSHYGLRRIRAATALQNAASRQVLTKAGFVPVGPADPADLGGKPGTWYERVLA